MLYIAFVCNFFVDFFLFTYNKNLFSKKNTGDPSFNCAPRCNIEPEIFTHQNFARAGIRSRVDSGESSVLTARLHMLYQKELLYTPFIIHMY